MNSQLRDAILWHSLGYTPLPVAPDGSKRPAVLSWTSYQTIRPSLTETIDLFVVDHDGLGVICGNTSGGLEMLEAEGIAVTEGFVARLAQAFADHDRADLWQTVSGGYAETTPGGGLHWYYRVSGAAAKNTKLARRLATEVELAAAPGNKVRVLIETRGEGGFSVIAPSAGRTHSSQKAWTVLAGSPAGIPTISEDERDALYAIASTLDQMPEVREPPRALSLAGSGIRPGDDYNSRTSWGDILTPAGWVMVAHYGGNLYGWQRPGKRSRGISATSGRNDADNLYVFSTSTEFETEQPYTKFAAYCLLNHGGDYAAGAKALRAAGYGQDAPISPKGPLDTLGDEPQVLTSNTVSPSGVERENIISRPVLAAVDGNAVRVIDPERIARLGMAGGPTEDGTAMAVTNLHLDDLRYCPERGQWLTWTGSRWAWDISEQHREKVKAISRELPEDKDWRAYKKRALSSSGVSGIVRLAQSDPRLIVHIDDLDARPYELNTPGGIIDLLTGKLTPADPAHFHTRITPVTPDFDNPSPLLERFLATTFGGDEALTSYVQRLLGVSAIGTVLEQILIFAQGAGANGKSTLFEATMAALGTGEGGYATAVPSEMLMARKHAEHPAELAQLAGARLVVCSELDDGQRFAEARIKQLTGRDSVNARFMRGNPFTFIPSHTLWLIGNHRPETTAGGPAFWRRLKLVPFNHVVPEADRDVKLVEKLAAEAPAVLAWLARGAASYLFMGLDTPASVEVATEAYETDQDTVGRFVDEACHVIPNSDLIRVPMTHLRDAYEDFCRELGDRPVTAKKLSMDLRDRYGIQAARGAQGQRFYVGIALVDPGQPVTSASKPVTSDGDDPWA